MKDFLGMEVEVGDIILYGNNAGFITLAIVTEIKDDRLQIIKRGYRDSALERELLVPSNVLIVTNRVLGSDPFDCASPEEINFVLTEHAKFMTSL